MVATLMSLRWRLAWRELRARPWIILLYVAAVPMVLLLLGTVLAGAVAATRLATTERSDTLVTACTVLSLLALLVIVFFVGMSSDMDPARFQTLPVDARALRPGLLATMLVSAGGGVTLVLTLLLAVAWRDDPGALAAALLGAVVGTLSIALAGLTLTSVLAAALHRRRTRELAVAALSLSGVVLGLGPQVIMRVLTSAHGRPALPPHPLGALLSWLPTGWAWAVPGDVAAGRWAQATARTVLAACLLLVLWTAWGRALDHALTSPMQASAGSRPMRRRQVTAARGGGPVRAVLGRELLLVRRDSRRWPQLLMTAMFPVMFMVTSRSETDPWAYALGLGALVSAGTVGTVALSTLSLTGTAGWTDLAAGLRGWQERAGSALATLLTAGPLPVVMALAVLALGAPQGPAVLGMTLALLGAGVGVGTAAATLYTVRMPPPGGNPFRTGNNSLEAAGVSLAAMALVVGVALPALVAGGFGWDGGGAAWVTLALGLGYLVVAPLAGVHLGGRRLDARWPEILQRV